MRRLFGAGVPRAAARNLRRVGRFAGPNGAVGVLRIGRPVREFRCWRVDFSTGESPRGCAYTFPTGPWVQAYLVQPAGRDLFVIGRVRPPVVTVKLRFANGETLTARPTAGIYVFPIPRSHLRRERQLAFVRGYGADRHVVQRAGVVFRARS